MLFFFFFLKLSFFFFFPFKPVLQIKLDTIHRRQETLEGAVCWVGERPRALCISLPSLPLALTCWLLGVTSWLHISWGRGGTPGGTALLFRTASDRHMIWGLSKPMGDVCWVSRVLVFIPANCTRSQRSKAKCHRKPCWICKLSFQYVHRLHVRVAEE